MELTWPLLGFNAILIGIGWSMNRSSRERKEQRIRRRSSGIVSPRSEVQKAAALQSGELHCPHCGHIIGDQDFARQHAWRAYGTVRESPLFRRSNISPD